MGQTAKGCLRKLCIVLGVMLLLLYIFQPSNLTVWVLADIPPLKTQPRAALEGIFVIDRIHLTGDPKVPSAFGEHHANHPNQQHAQSLPLFPLDTLRKPFAMIATILVLMVYLWRFAIHSWERRTRTETDALRDTKLSVCALAGAANIRMVDPTEAYRLWDSRSCIILDVRTSGEAEASMSAGSPSGIAQIPLIEMDYLYDQGDPPPIAQWPNEGWMEEVYQKFPNPMIPIIVMCSDGRQRSPQAAKLLCEAGYKRVMLLRGGFHEFQEAAGVPVEPEFLEPAPSPGVQWLDWKVAVAQLRLGDPMPRAPFDEMDQEAELSYAEDLHGHNSARDTVAVGARPWEFTSTQPSQYEMQEFLEWFTSEPYLESHVVEPNLDDEACKQLQSLVHKCGLHCGVFDDDLSRILVVSKSRKLSTPNQDDIPHPVRLQDAPREVREPICLFLKQRKPVCAAMPTRRMWPCFVHLARMNNISIRLLRDLECVILVDTASVVDRRMSGTNPHATRPFASDIVSLSSQLMHYLKKAVDEAWFRHEPESNHLDVTRRGPRHSLLPQSTADYAIDYQERRNFDNFRLTLPIYKARVSILDAIDSNRVVILDGPTGAGKSTQVPQYIIDATGLLPADSPVVIVTQPRRLAAINVAQRVAEERGQQLGDEVGYQVRFDNCLGPNTRLIFMTSGVLLRRLHDDPTLQGVGCVIVDEVHERSLDIDFILLLMKQSLLSNRTKARLVVMSATMQAKTFVDYFQEVINMDCSRNQQPLYPPVPNHVHFEGRQYPVKDFYLEDALVWTGFAPHGESNELVPTGEGEPCGPSFSAHLQQEGDGAELIRQMQTPVSTSSTSSHGHQPNQSFHSKDDEDEEWDELPDEDLLLASSSWDVKADPNIKHQETSQSSAHSGGHGPRDSDFDHKNVAATVDFMRVHPCFIAHLIAELHYSGFAGGILVFLPGIKEIRGVRKALLGLPASMEMNIIILHSQLPLCDQRQLFEVSWGGKRKVVLATNIAESSVTVEDIVFVIDSGLMKAQQYNAARDLSSREDLLVSKANAIQRRGRAGRVQPGICIHLFPQEHFERLRDAMESELLRVPLEEVVLQLSALGVKDPQRFLRQAIDAPKPQAVHNAMKSLTALGALSNEQHPVLTHLGHTLAILPLHPKMGRMLLLAAIMGALEPMLTIVAIISNKCPYVQTLNPEEAKEHRKHRLRYNDKYVQDSDPILLLRLYEQWVKLDKRTQAEFCRRCGLSPNVMKEIRNTREQYASLLQSDLNMAVTTFNNRHAQDANLVSSLVAMCLYPNVAIRKKRRWWTPDGRCFVDVQASSVLRFPHPAPLDLVDQKGLYMAYVERNAVTTRGPQGIEDSYILVEGSSIMSQLPLILACHTVQPVPMYCGVDPEGSPILLCDDWLALRFDSVELLQVVTKAHFLLHEALETFARTQQLEGHFVQFLDAIAQCVSPDMNTPWVQHLHKLHQQVDLPVFRRKLLSMEKIEYQEDPALVPQYQGRPVRTTMPPRPMWKGKGKGPWR